MTITANLNQAKNQKPAAYGHLILVRILHRLMWEELLAKRVKPGK